MITGRGKTNGNPIRLSGNQLKLIAVVTMLLDHIGYLLVGQGCVVPRMMAGEPYQDWWMLYSVYSVLRMTGRVAFPVFCFLLVEGFLHTKNWKKYALRLGLFALISEVPFDLFDTGMAVSWETQNVFFVLFLGLLMLKCLQLLEARMPDGIAGAGLWLELAVIGGFCIAAWLVRADYNYIGIMLIAVLYLFRRDPVRMCLMGFIWMALMQRTLYLLPGFAAGFLAIYCYSGQRGKWRGKYFFYLFYPVHLLVLAMVNYIIFGKH